jgi:hypothetical protein
MKKDVFHTNADHYTPEKVLKSLYIDYKAALRGPPS